MDELQKCSLAVSTILDHMGYCRWIRDARKASYKNICDILNILGIADGQFMVAGSKAEGLSHWFQSDIDLLLTSDSCEVHEAVDDLTVLDDTKFHFKCERGLAAPGYCLLTLIKKPRLRLLTRRHFSVERCIRDLKGIGVEILDSGLFLRFYIRGAYTGHRIPSGMHSIEQSKVGPSRLYLTGPFLYQVDVDTVDYISLPRSADLDIWSKRPRHHDWPSESLRQDIVSTPANLTPIGSKKGYYGKMEWRVCFNRVEIMLMNSLNQTQLHLFVTLKMILKDHLKPEKKEVTSYVMKNIVLWMCETNPVKSFTRDTLLYWVHKGLETLKDHIQKGNLPYYLIPERNLLQGKFVDEESKSAMLGKLDELLAAGPNVVNVCTTIKFGLDLYHGKLLGGWGWRRNLVETWLVYSRNVACDSINVKFRLLQANGIEDPLSAALMSDLDKLIEIGVSASELGELFKNRVCIFLDVQKADEIAERLDFSQEPFACSVQKLMQKYELRMKERRRNIDQS